MEKEQVVIIGSGPAGLAAAIYTARANLKPLVFGGSPYGGQLMLTTEVENFPGFPTIMGPDLINKMREQVKGLGVRIFDQNITSIDFSKRPFTLSSVDKTVTSEAIIIATGAKALWLGLENETRLRGRGVSACATCDGFFFRNKVVAVVGGGDTAMEEALTLSNFASKVILIHRREEFRASKIMADRVKKHPKIELILNTRIADVLGEQKVSGVKLEDVKTNVQRDLEVDGLFIAIGHKPDTELFKDAIKLDEKGYILTNAMLAEHVLTGKGKAEVYQAAQKDNCYYSSMTSLEGVFAAGDCVDHVYRQAATAAGMGVASALDVERWLAS